MAGKRDRPEDRIQRAIVQLLTLAARPGVWFCAIPNGGFRPHLEAAIMNGLGVRKGAPDLLIVGPASRAHFLEVKAPGGRLTDEQDAFRTWCALQGVPHAVVHSVDEAIVFLRSFGLIRVRMPAAIDRSAA